MEKQYQIAVAGTGYVGMSIAVLLAQHHPVFAVDIIPEKVQMIQNRQSPIQDTYIEQYLTQKELQQRWMQRQPIDRRILWSLPLLPTMTARRISSIPLRWSRSLSW